MPPTVFPVNSVKAIAGCIYLGQRDAAGRVGAVSMAFGGDDEGYFKGRVLTDIFELHRYRSATISSPGSATRPLKDQLKANTAE